MPPKYQGRKTFHKVPSLPSDDDSRNSPEQEGDDIVQIFAAFHNRMERKAKDMQRRLSSDCETVIQHITEMAHELVFRQKQELEAKVKGYKRKQEELEEENLAVIKKLRSEEAKYLRLHDSIISELDKVEMAQMKTIQAFEKKYSSFIDDSNDQLQSPIVGKSTLENPFVDKMRQVSFLKFVRCPEKNVHS
ncbi:10227_t:CDS:2 [Acaulospora morrowiae]|uniref:10227_t:CDS:1 n=1 Tax=Acaulospora morrowiae TaxID=94023 RepID=A0A9N9B6L3_9GLOM|nr:10227_t:CDS:2 [Acaulospora morrowiae]